MRISQSKSEPAKNIQVGQIITLQGNTFKVLKISYLKIPKYDDYWILFHHHGGIIKARRYTNVRIGTTPKGIQRYFSPDTFPQTEARPIGLPDESSFMINPMLTIKVNDYFDNLVRYSIGSTICTCDLIVPMDSHCFDCGKLSIRPKAKALPPEKSAEWMAEWKRKLINGQRQKKEIMEHGLR